MPRKKTTTKARPTEGQKKRVPLHQSRDILSVIGIKIKDHVTRLVNDGMPNDPYRIQRFLDAGWKFVHKNQENGDVTLGERTVNSAESTDSLVSRPVGKGVTTYLMAIHKDLYKEDQEAKQARVDESERAMKATGKEEGKYGSIQLEN